MLLQRCWKLSAVHCSWLNCWTVVHSKASGDLVTNNLQPVQRSSKQHCVSAEKKTVSKLDICCKVPYQKARQCAGNYATISVGAPLFPWPDSEAVAGIRCTVNVQCCPCLLLLLVSSLKDNRCTHLLSVFAYCLSLISPHSPSVLAFLSTFWIAKYCEFEVAPLASSRHHAGEANAVSIFCCYHD